MLARDVDAFFVKLARGFEVMQFAVDPADAIRKTRMPEEIAIATRFLHRVVERRERGGHLALIPLRQADEEHRRQHQEAVAQLRSESHSFLCLFDRELVFRLEEVQTRTPRDAADECWFVIKPPRGCDDVVEHSLSFLQLAVAKMLQTNH